MVSGSVSTSCQECFSPFPHGTGTLSVSKEYLALPDGPGRFALDSSCPALLRMPLRFGTLRVRSCHALRRRFPAPSTRVLSCGGAVLQPPPRRDAGGLGWSPFARHYWGNHSCFLFLRVLRCFSSPRWPPDDAGWRAFSTPGCPIREPADQRLHAPPRGFSQLAAPFVASWSLGIRHAPFFTFAIHRRLMPASAAYFGVRSPCGPPLVFPSLLVTTCHRTSFRVENNGFEPLTPCLQSRCSSQLS